MTNEQIVGVGIITYLLIWVAIFEWIINNDVKAKARKIMESTTEVYRMVILGIEHFALFTVGFLGGAFKSKYYLNTKLFTKEEVRGLVNMALGEERRKESSLISKTLRKLK